MSADAARPGRRKAARPAPAPAPADTLAEIEELRRELDGYLGAGDDDFAASTLLQIAQRYVDLGDPGRAAPCYERVLRLAVSKRGQYAHGMARKRLAKLAKEAPVRPPPNAGPAVAPAASPPGDPAGHDARCLGRVVDALRGLGALTDPARVAEAIVERAIALAGAERGFLALATPSGPVLKVARDLTGAPLREPDLIVSRSVLELALRDGVPILAADASTDERFRASESVRSLKVRSVLAVPLMTGAGAPLGAIYLDHRLKARAFALNDVEALVPFAVHATVALERARALEDLEAAHVEIERLTRVVDRAGPAAQAPRPEVVASEAPAAGGDDSAFEGIVGRSPAMRAVFGLIERVAPADLPVFIHGETGTGKELVARALHARSPRRPGPFVAESCAALPESLLESELFGHERGAFTGATGSRAGLLERASGGTLFLDEVGEMSPALQGKLLRTLQEREVRRIGAPAARRIDVRLVTASNRDLRDLVAQGKFRQDLFFRLHVVRVDLPPLRERPGDIPLLAERILARLAPGGRPPPLVPAARRWLVHHLWPGNVRELENALRRAVTLSGGGPIEVDHLAPDTPGAGAPGGAPSPGGGATDATDGGDGDAGPIPRTLAEERARARLQAGGGVERAFLERALVEAGGNVTRAAGLVGVSRATIHRMLARHGLRGADRRRS